MLRRSTLLLLVLALISCGGSSKPKEEKSTTITFAANSLRFEPSFHPSRIGSYEEYRRAIDSYWDGFDFAADTLVTKYERTSLIEAFANYVVYIEPPRADSLLRHLIHRAEASRPVLDLFVDISEKVLHDPNSPLRNDEYYIPILEELMTSPLMDEYDRIIFDHDLAIARKNRVGAVATDFSFITADGREARLSDIKARYTLLMFNNPECNMCRDIMSEIESSPLLNALIDAEQLKVIAICPDGATEVWREKVATMPAGWIVAYDKDSQISTHNLYDLRAIPSLYLLDSAKRVIIKDGTNVGYIEAVISR